MLGRRTGNLGHSVTSATPPQHRHGLRTVSRRQLVSIAPVCYHQSQYKSFNPTFIFARSIELLHRVLTHPNRLSSNLELLNKTTINLTSPCHSTITGFATGLHHLHQSPGASVNYANFSSELSSKALSLSMSLSLWTGIDGSRGTIILKPWKAIILGLKL